MMKTSKVAIFLAKALVAILIGNVLFRITAGLPSDMPSSVDAALRWAFHARGHGELANTDDMEAIAELAVIVATTAVGVAIVRGVHGVVRRLRRAARTPDREGALERGTAHAACWL